MCVFIMTLTVSYNPADVFSEIYFSVETAKFPPIQHEGKPNVLCDRLDEIR